MDMIDIELYKDKTGKSYWLISCREVEHEVKNGVYHLTTHMIWEHKGFGTQMLSIVHWKANLIEGGNYTKPAVACIEEYRLFGRIGDHAQK